jgi:hypothetical protein
VFYDESGNQADSPGFDAVIGNPPWAVTTDERQKEYLWSVYQYQSNKPDLYRFFIEKCFSLTSGKFSMITPNTWFVMGAAKSLRQHVLGNGYLSRASTVPLDAFEEVDANMITFQMDVGDRSDEIDVWDLHRDGDATYLRTIEYDDVSKDSYKIELHVGNEERKIAAKMEAASVPLESVADITTGYQLYHTSIHSDDVIEGEIYHSDTKKTEDYIPEIR